MSDEARKRLGRRAEKLAARELRRRGYRVVVANWRCEIGEVDLIARDGGDLVVVEVKARIGDDFGGPELQVGPAKQRKLSRLLDRFLMEQAAGEVNCRFDVVALVLDARGRVVRAEVYGDAFEYVEP